MRKNRTQTKISNAQNRDVSTPPKAVSQASKSKGLPINQEGEPSRIPIYEAFAKGYVSPATRGRIVAALKSGKQTPNEIAKQAGISIETLAEWTRICMGLVDEGQSPVDIFWMFRNCDPLAQSSGKSSPKQTSCKTPPKPLRQSKIKAQLCWDCINAVPDGKHGCPWSNYFKPVEGWEAEKTDISYHITSCPLFERD